ncbi:MAG: PilZ domain-containing protein [bacterium]|nr:PilZ domain-containing protein [bacterium]
MRQGKAERRRHRRHTDAVCAWLEFDTENAVRGMVSTDLSIEGARFASVRPVRPGDRALLCMQLGANPHAIECKARVCWSETMPDGLHYFGVRFIDLHCEEEEALAGFLGERQRTPVLAAV